MTDIRSKEDIQIFVDAFYMEVRKDPLIGGVFAARIKNNQWDVHLERMYSFWNTVLFGQADYRGNPFAKHAELPIEAQHFDRWIELLNKTIDSHYVGEKAEEVKLRGTKMGAMFLSKLEYLRSNPQQINLI